MDLKSPFPPKGIYWVLFWTHAPPAILLMLAGVDLFTGDYVAFNRNIWTTASIMGLLIMMNGGVNYSIAAAMWDTVVKDSELKLLRTRMLTSSLYGFCSMIITQIVLNLYPLTYEGIFVGLTPILGLLILQNRLDSKFYDKGYAAPYFKNFRFYTFTAQLLILLTTIYVFYFGKW